MNILFAFNTLLILSLYTPLFAQNSNTLDYLVLTNGDTLYGKVNYIDESSVNRSYYKKIRLTDIYGNQKKHKRKEVAAFQVNTTNYERFWLNQSAQKVVFSNPKYEIDHENGELYFLRVVSKGKLSHYELEWFEQGESLLMSMDLLKKEEDQFFVRATQGLLGLKRKVLSNYFINCSLLKEQIKQKSLNEVWQVVDFYNDNCSY